MPDGTADVDDELRVEVRPLQTTKISHRVANIVQVLTHDAKGKYIEPIVIDRACFCAIARPALIIARHQMHVHLFGIGWHGNGGAELQRAAVFRAAE